LAYLNIYWQNIVSAFEVPDMILIIWYQPISRPALSIWQILLILTTNIDDIGIKNHWRYRYWYWDFKPCSSIFM